MAYKLKIVYKTQNEIPLYESGYATGFPSPAEDYMVGRIDITKVLMSGNGTDFICITGDSSMDSACIGPNDLLIAGNQDLPEEYTVGFFYFGRSE